MITRRTLIIGSTAGAAAAALARPAVAQQVMQPTPEQVYFDPANPVLGNPKGDVTIAEFFDFQCPYCKRDFPRIRDFVEKDGKIRLVMKDWPIFGETSVYASQLVLGAKTIGKYRPAFNALMTTEAKLSRKQVQSTLAKAGLDVDELHAAYLKNKADIDAGLLRNNTEAESFAFPGTPAYVIGKALYFGVMDKGALKAAVALARGA